MSSTGRKELSSQNFARSSLVNQSAESNDFSRDIQQSANKTFPRLSPAFPDNVANTSDAQNVTKATVWAPKANQIELIALGRTVPLVRDKDGWWSADVSALASGCDYQFRVDGKVLPDPRSPWQPYGVHGPSRVVDHEEFQWTDSHWQAKPLASAVIYEIHVGTFTSAGTFGAAIEHLDYLVELGITHIELMPIAEFLGDRGWGYDGVCLYAPHHAYGTPLELKQFVNACHSKGLAVLLDVVYNHLGPIGNYLPQFGPFFTDRHCTPWGAAINYDGPDSDEVRRYFVENALMWLRDYHFDGLRLDAVHSIVDHSATHFLEMLAREVKELEAQLGRHLVLIAESDLNDPRVVRPWDSGGYGIDAQWCDDIHHAIHTVLTGERAGYYVDFGTLSDLAIAMGRPYVYAGQHSLHRRRIHGKSPGDLPASRFVAYTQTHDQIGNRASGERLCHLVNADRCKIAAALVLLSPYVPMLFQGEEWAASSPFLYFVGFEDEPDLAAAVAQGRQAEFRSFGWSPEKVVDPTDVRAFQQSKLCWQELSAQRHAEMLEWYRKLILLRRTCSAFTSSDRPSVHFSEADRWLRIDRPSATIICNFANVPNLVPVDEGREQHVILASRPTSVGPNGAIRLLAESIVVLGVGN